MRSEAHLVAYITEANLRVFNDKLEAFLVSSVVEI